MRGEEIEAQEGNMALVEIVDIVKHYQMGEFTVEALRGITASFEAGEYVAIMGPSGSGKSTFMNILGCLDTPTAGQYILDNDDVSTLTDDELSEIRSTRIGFVFQSFNLIPQLSVLENIEVPLFYQRVSEEESRERAKSLAESVGLGHRLKHNPTELSGGEQQRVAIARAMANDPLIVLADEPTGNLDSISGEEILKIIDRLNEEGKTIITVTHDEHIASRAHRIIRFMDGSLQSDEKRGSGS